MTRHIQLTIKVGDPALNDQLIAMLAHMNFDGFEETEGELKAYIDERSFNESEVSHICMLLDVEYSVSIIEQQNWNALWESNFEPVVVEDFCTIRAEFHAPASSTQHEIVITPKMSFGTGHHATTYLMIKQMSEIDFCGKSVADFGTGTGILAIMAEKLGASEVLAIDYDDWCIENSLENIDRNGCTKIEVSKSDHFSSSKPYDIVLANINRNVIVDNLSALTEGVARGGYLLLSGLLTSDETAVVTAFQENGFNLVNRSERNNWICLLLEL